MKRLIWLLILFGVFKVQAQTTDLAISIEAQTLAGASISQVPIFTEYAYLITISNTGAATANAPFSATIGGVYEIVSVTDRNAVGGAVPPINLTTNNTTGVVNGLLPNMPSASSIQLLVVVRSSPTFLGGISATARINPPAGTTDSNPASNTSTISIIATNRDTDFQITQSQIMPAGGAPISNWGDAVTYSYTIKNNSGFEFPLDAFRTSIGTTNGAGTTNAILQSVTCVSSTGMPCPNLTGISANPNAELRNFNYDTENTDIIFPDAASFTIEVRFVFNEGACTPNTNLNALIVANRVSITTFGTNLSPVTNSVSTTLLQNDTCPCTDLESNLTIVSPTTPGISSWNDIVTYDYTFINNGPLDVNTRAFFTNTSTGGVEVEFLTVTCIVTTGTIACSDVAVAITPGSRWFTDPFMLPANASVTFRTTLRFIEPECLTGNLTPDLRITATTNIVASTLTDCLIANNSQTRQLTGLPVVECDPNSSTVDGLTLSETQINPAPTTTPIPWGPVTYEITFTNTNTVPVPVKFIDSQGSRGTGILTSITCTGTTGGAACPTSFNDNIGVSNSQGDTFWEIIGSDGYVLPPNSSVIFEKIVDWTPPCQVTPFLVADNLVLDKLDSNGSVENTLSVAVSTLLVPCVDLVVQTFPSVTSTTPAAALDWIVDVTNSNISVTATNVTFQNDLHPDFVINGTPSCTLQTGVATCTSNVVITGNTVAATIQRMEPGATIRIRIPVLAPNYGGSFENTAQAQPDFNVTGENTPASNISNSSLFVLSTGISKTFEPPVISIGETSVLTFTLTNSNGNPAQQNISFTDVLPAEITLSGIPSWVQQNGATGNFVGTIGSPSVGISNLSIPAGVSSVSFQVQVTSNTTGTYINDFQNFSNLNNIDPSAAFATLRVTPIVDLAITKTVDNASPQPDEEVTFLITAINLGSDDSLDAVVNDFLPNGYTYVSHVASVGTFDPTTGIWQIGLLTTSMPETLSITVSLMIPGDFLNIASIADSNVASDINLENNTASAQVRPDCIELVSGFSPNNDGINDFFEIECIDSYPDNNLKIFNRWGTVVYEATNYRNTWDGRPNSGPLHNDNELLPVGVYFYVLDLNDGSTPRSSWVYLNY